MVVTIAASETWEKVSIACSSVRDLAAPVFLLLALAVLNQHATSG
jgi:hypothetical protein